METVKTTDEYVIVKKRSGRYGVRNAKKRAWVNGEEKEKILLAEGLIKKSVAQAKPEQPAEGGEEGGSEE